MSFRGEQLVGSSYRRFIDIPGGAETRVTEFAEFCGDVSGSPEWEAVRAGLGAEGPLCLSVMLAKHDDGTHHLVAEVIFGQADIGWVFGQR